jgi:hypothetical protein
VPGPQRLFEWQWVTDVLDDLPGHWRIGELAVEGDAQRPAQLAVVPGGHGGTVEEADHRDQVDPAVGPRAEDVLGTPAGAVAAKATVARDRQARVAAGIGASQVGRQHVHQVGVTGLLDGMFGE